MKNKNGFTLLELMVAVAMIAIVVMIAAPSWKEFLSNRRTAGASREIYNALQHTRMKAIKEGKTITVEYCDGDGGVVNVPAPADPPDPNIPPKTAKFEKMFICWNDGNNDIKEEIFLKLKHIDCDTNQERMAYNSRGILVATNSGTVRTWSSLTKREYSVVIGNLGTLRQASGMHQDLSPGT
ncbi:Tfp pilus assembly protein FimT/FimU [Desulfoluna sp.]|uniref:pilus assembly FimT family protein n=1 Tax=Desulfoluna sp. TaxID=2045199 RepID=UPI00262088B8|nr:GspH/FimT family pseudopilin [Desulfoluna sp.]